VGKGAVLNVKWNKLVKVDGKTRIVSIRTKLLEEAGIDPQAELQDVGSQSRAPETHPTHQGDVST